MLTQEDIVSTVALSKWDGKPIKNRLPAEVMARMKTEAQWLEAGFRLKPNAVGYEMHASVMGKKLFTYYVDTDVEPIVESNVPQNCMTCKMQARRYCIIAGDYVSEKNSCSEWCHR